MRQKEEEMDKRYSKIADFFAFAEKEYQIQICIKDYSGFVPVNKDLDEALQPYLAHTNPFCMYIKSEKAVYHRCLSMSRKMNHRCQKEGKTFFGMCHGGLCEYVTPIINRNLVIGTINIGFFPGHEALSFNRIRHVCQASATLKEETAIALYRQSIFTPSIRPEALIPLMELIAEYLSFTYDTMESTRNSSGRRHYNSNEDTILSHAAKYIRQNFTQRITMEELADFCHCSQSHLSHIFKRRIQVNVNTYINKVRIEASKNFLVETDISIGDIAFHVGFNDSNYYTRVFTQLVSISPREYRRRFKHNGEGLHPL